MNPICFRFTAQTDHSLLIEVSAFVKQKFSAMVTQVALFYNKKIGSENKRKNTCIFS